MTDAPATPKPRRRWKRWAAFAFLFVVLATWLLFPEPPEIERAKGVKFGMNESQVEEIVGSDRKLGFSYSGPNGTGLVRGATRMRLYLLARAIENKVGLQLFDFYADFDSWPVHIHFDNKLRCDRIKRGSEILVRPPKPKREGRDVKRPEAKSAPPVHPPGSI